MTWLLHSILMTLFLSIVLADSEFSDDDHRTVGCRDAEENWRELGEEWRIGCRRYCACISGYRVRCVRIRCVAPKLNPGCFAYVRRRTESESEEEGRCCLVRIFCKGQVTTLSPKNVGFNTQRRMPKTSTSPTTSYAKVTLHSTEQSRSPSHFSYQPMRHTSQYPIYSPRSYEVPRGKSTTLNESGITDLSSTTAMAETLPGRMNLNVKTSTPSIKQNTDTAKPTSVGIDQYVYALKPSWPNDQYTDTPKRPGRTEQYINTLEPSKGIEQYKNTPEPPWRNDKYTYIPKPPSLIEHYTDTLKPSMGINLYTDTPKPSWPNGLYADNPNSAWRIEQYADAHKPSMEIKQYTDTLEPSWRNELYTGTSTPPMGIEQYTGTPEPSWRSHQYTGTPKALRQIEQYTDLPKSSWRIDDQYLYTLRPSSSNDQYTDTPKPTGKIHDQYLDTPKPSRRIDQYIAAPKPLNGILELSVNRKPINIFRKPNSNQLSKYDGNHLVGSSLKTQPLTEKATVAHRSLELDSQIRIRIQSGRKHWFSVNRGCVDNRGVLRRAGEEWNERCERACRCRKDNTDFLLHCNYIDCHTDVPRIGCFRIRNPKRDDFKGIHCCDVIVCLQETKCVDSVGRSHDRNAMWLQDGFICRCEVNHFDNKLKPVCFRKEVWW